MPFCLLHPQPVLFATLYLPIFYAIWTKGSGMRAAVPEPHRNSAPTGAGRGTGQHAHSPCGPRGAPIPDPLKYVQGGT